VQRVRTAEAYHDGKHRGKVTGRFRVSGVRVSFNFRANSNRPRGFVRGHGEHRASSVQEFAGSKELWEKTAGSLQRVRAVHVVDEASGSRLDWREGRGRDWLGTTSKAHNTENQSRKVLGSRRGRNPGFTIARRIPMPDVFHFPSGDRFQFS